MDEDPRPIRVSAAIQMILETPVTDGELIERTLAGDEAAFAQIVERYQKAIYRVASAIVRDPMEADIVSQDTFVQAYMNLSKFQGRSELETWLTRIAINRAKDSLRSRRWVSLEGSGPDGDEREIELADNRPDPERELSGRELQVAIDRAVDGLSGQQKIVFTLRHYEERSLEEISTLLGLRSGTVRAHLFRAVHKVRRELSSWLGRNGSSEGNDDENTLL